MLLITIGVGKLVGLQVSARYHSAMLFIFCMAILSLIKSVIIQFGSVDKGSIAILLLIGSLVSLVATVIFCGCMREICMKAGLESAGNSWKATRTLFIIIYLIPLGACYLIFLPYMIMGKTLHYNGAWVLLLIPIFFFPLIHLFVSTSRMKRSAMQASKPAPEAIPPSQPRPW
jgi:hypothetical protein